MTDVVLPFESIALWAVAVGTGLALALTLAVIVERIALAANDARLRRIERQYGPLIARALDGEQDAARQLASSPSRDRFSVARLLITPLIVDRDPERIAATRAIVRAMSLAPVADGLLRSHWWWRRGIGVQVIGLLQMRDRTGAVVAALEDSNADVRNAAMDALADMQDPAALQAIALHLHNASLRRGPRAAAIAAFGSQCEAFLLDLSHVDAEHRLNYARALAICGTGRSRAALCEWTTDPRVEVRAAAFEALGHVGLDATSASLAIGALDSGDVAVRAMAAAALLDWTGEGDAARHLGQHLDDAWTVAVRAARSLQSMREPGLAELQVRAERQDLAGALARQMLWEAEVHR
jgi:HEAT repeat protein